MLDEHQDVQPGDSAGQPLNRVFERHRLSVTVWIDPKIAATIVAIG
jgi:hypothetical protein